MKKMDRRDFLRAAAGLGALGLFGSILPHCFRNMDGRLNKKYGIS